MNEVQDFVADEILSEELKPQGQKISMRFVGFCALAGFIIIVLGMVTISRL